MKKFYIVYEVCKKFKPDSTVITLHEIECCKYELDAMDVMEALATSNRGTFYTIMVCYRVEDPLENSLDAPLPKTERLSSLMELTQAWSQ